MKIISLYKKTVAVVLAVVLALGALPFVAYAEDEANDASPKIVEITSANFPDSNIIGVARSKDSDGDGWLSQNEIADIKSIGLGMFVKDCTGIEYFTELRELRVNSAQDLKKIDVSNNTKLETLMIVLSKITDIDLSRNTALKSLYLYNNKLTSLDLSKNTELTYLDCSGNQISDFVLGDCPNLESIDCSNNKIGGVLDLSSYSKLSSVYFSKNPITEISLNGLENLNKVTLSHASLGSFSVADCPQLKKIDCSDNDLASIAIRNCPVTELILTNNRLENLDNVEINTVESLKVENNRLKKLDTSAFANLGYLLCDNNEITSLNFDNNSQLYWLECKNNKLTSLKIIDEERVLEGVICSDNPIETLELSGERLQNVVCENGRLTSTEKINAPILLYLNVNNNLLKNIDISVYPNLIDLFCNDNQLEKIDLSRNGGKIWRVYCENNNLTALDAEKNPLLSYTYSTDNYCIWARGNTFEIEPDESGRYDLSKLAEISGFDVSRASNWTGGTVDGNILTVAPGAKEVTYTYLMKAENNNGDPVAETFTLLLPKNECTHTDTSVVGTKAATCKDKGFTGDTVCND